MPSFFSDAAPVVRRYLATRESNAPRSGDLRPLARTAALCLLVFVLVVVAYEAGHGHGGSSRGAVADLEVRVDQVAGQVTALRSAVHAAAKRADAAAAAAAKASKRAASADPQPSTACLAEMQREIDDLQAYLAYRTPLRSDRVSGSCSRLLTPRFQGS